MRAKRRRLGSGAAGVAIGMTLMIVPGIAAAFCGFYVSGADAELYNNASVVVMMREGTRTVLSMQNNYEGPPEDFALVVPVPVVLQEENVRTLPHDIFDRVDQMASPRLVEYWERDPCEPELVLARQGYGRGGGGVVYLRTGVAGNVVVEAQFEVGEYEIVILSADDSSALDTWLRDNGYRIPEGAEPVLRPYVAAGTKFFVAKVNVDRVEMVDGQAMLSPLRFHYDSETFSLPVRLGLLNAKGHQDLLVHILAPNQRYEVANFPNVTIPTNLDLDEEAAERFGEFYAALLDKTLEVNPGAVVTEYAWAASSCDPCPGPTLGSQDFLTLGADVLPTGGISLVLTRLHARYTSDTLGDDLVFRAAAPIAGGREVYATVEGAGDETVRRLEHGAQASSVNNFQGRYAVRHEWRGPIECEDPVRGRWGGPWDGPGSHRGAGSTRAARDLAFVPRGQVELARLVREDIPELGVLAWQEPTVAPEPPVIPVEQRLPQTVSMPDDTASCAAVPAAPAVVLPWLVAGLVGVFWLRRRA